MYEYIYGRLLGAYKYFGVPQTTDGPLFTQLKDSEKTLLEELRTDLLSMQGSFTSNHAVIRIASNHAVIILLDIILFCRNMKFKPH